MLNFAIIRMFYISYVHVVTTSLMWLSSTWNVANVTEEGNF